MRLNIHEVSNEHKALYAVKYISPCCGLITDRVPLTSTLLLYLKRHSVRQGLITNQPYPTWNPTSASQSPTSTPISSNILPHFAGSSSPFYRFIFYGFRSSSPT